MHILCPHCHNPIEVVKLSAHEEIACPSCGSSFRLETDTTTTPEYGSSQQLGRFELLGVVGRGAFGTMYKARDPELDRTVAVKVPQAGNLAGAEELDRFLREARSAAQLRQQAVGQSQEEAWLAHRLVIRAISEAAGERSRGCSLPARGGCGIRKGLLLPFVRRSGVRN
jgi:hypothetical protein